MSLCEVTQDVGHSPTEKQIASAINSEDRWPETVIFKPKQSEGGSALEHRQRQFIVKAGIKNPRGTVVIPYHPAFQMHENRNSPIARRKGRNFWDPPLVTLLCPPLLCSALPTIASYVLRAT